MPAVFRFVVAQISKLCKLQQQQTVRVLYWSVICDSNNIVFCKAKMSAKEIKRLEQELKANTDKYVRGEYDQLKSLAEIDELFKKSFQKKDEVNIIPEIMQDSSLMHQHAKIAKESVRLFNPDSLVFDPIDFSMKLKQYFCPNMTDSVDTTRSSSTQDNDFSSLWLQLGEKAKSLLYTVPTFSYMYGTFDPDPVNLVKKPRKVKEKDKVQQATQPQSVVMGMEETDYMRSESENVLNILIRLWAKTQKKAVCYFEFVTHPTSYAETVENIFLVSVLVKMGYARIVLDDNGLPCLVEVSESEQKQLKRFDAKHFVISINQDEWKAIVKKLKITKPLIVHKKSLGST